MTPPRPPTREYTALAARPRGNRADFRTSRASALVLGGLTAVAAVVCAAWSGAAPGAGP